jgi:hypothetical protein
MILISLTRLPFGLEPLEISSKGLSFAFVPGDSVGDLLGRSENV